MSFSRETFVPYAYEEGGRFFTKKRTDLKMDQVNSYLIDGNCVFDSSPNWSTGFFWQVWQGRYSVSNLKYTLVEIVDIENPDLTVTETFYEWK
jgi:hypothetical protein